MKALYFNSFFKKENNIHSTNSSLNLSLELNNFEIQLKNEAERTIIFGFELVTVLAINVNLEFLVSIFF